MHVMIVQIHVKPDCVRPFIEATTENARNSRQEPGVARFDFLQQEDDPTRFVLVEAYRTPADVDRHRKTPHYAKWTETVKNMFAETRTRAFYRNCDPPDALW